MFATWFRPKASPVFDPGSPAQASLPIQPLPRERSLTIYSTARPEGSLAFRLSGLTLEPKLAVKTVRCSAALLGMITLASRFALPQSEDRFEPRRARGKIISSGASSRLVLVRVDKPAPERASPRFPFHRLPAEIGPSVACLPVEAGTSVPITNGQ